ncbi:MAG: hypothetical protein R1F52_06575 [Candidatus Nitrosoabyssus spongiisocia]|nr:MAG: hypothetical protein R1F52_06575 [Nitrosopumilaceae archaeon AB1(1)]
MKTLRFNIFRIYIIPYVSSILGIFSFSQIVELFGQTIPSTILSFFKVAGEVLIVLFVFIFALFWLLKAVPRTHNKSYRMCIFDICGREFTIEGIRTEFKERDVAWSFMKEYKKQYPYYNFALLSDLNIERKTIIKYI